MFKLPKKNLFKCVRCGSYRTSGLLKEHQFYCSRCIDIVSDSDLDHALAKREHINQCVNCHKFSKIGGVVSGSYYCFDCIYKLFSKERA
jgi:hypothetical protein